MQLAVFGKALDVIGALHLMKHHGIAPVRAGDGIAVSIEIQPPGIAASFGKQFERTGARVIAPDALLEADAADVGGDRASLGAVEPAIGAPLQGVGKGVGIVHAETAQQHLRVAIGHVVAVAVGIKEQVRRLDDENAAGAECHT